MSTRVTLTIAAALLLVPVAHGDVIVVDPHGGPGGGALLQQAIDAAQQGDILLLRPGDYTDVDVVAPWKLLSLVADAGGAQITLRRLVVKPSFDDGTILVRGVRAEPPSEPAKLASGLALGAPVSTPSTFWLEDCTVFGNPLDPDGPGPLAPQPGPALDVGFVTRAIVVRCEATGADGFDAPPGEAGAIGGGAGVSLNGNVVLDECTFTGGAGGDGPYIAPFVSDGGPGAIVEFGTMWLMDCALQGGDEGADNDATVKAGDGLVLGPTGVYLRDVTALPGDVVGVGTPGMPIDAAQGAFITTFPAAPRGLVVPAPLREDEDSVLSAHGVLGDAVFAWVADEASPINLPGKQGAFLIAFPFPVPVFLGVITDPAGALEVDFHVPLLPPGLDGEVLYLQSVMAPAAGGAVVGSGSAFVWIDSSF